jgi:nitrite reductase (NADH) small subunit
VSPATRWYRVTFCVNIPLREGRAIFLGSREIAIFNLGHRFLAIDNRCPHRGGPLADGIVAGTNIVCPLHAWKLSLETGEGVSAASAASCVAVFRTRIEDGVILVELPVESRSGKSRMRGAERNQSGDPQLSVAFQSAEKASLAQESMSPNTSRKDKLRWTT